VNVRSIVRVLALTACTAATLSTVVGGPASASEGTLARFAAAGVNIDRLEPGWTVAGDDIQWNGGRTGMTILTTGVDFSGGPCPYGYVCLFEHADMLGVMWYSNDRNRYLYLPELGFNDVMSSWQNRTPYDARWYFNTGGVPNPNFCMGAGGRDEHLPLDQNDQASTVYIYSSSTVC
jgi:Peptidase inhibitor family I36